MGAVQDLDCVSVEVEAHGPFGRVVHHDPDGPTIGGELTGLPPRQLLPHSSEGLADEADGTLSRVEVDAQQSLGPENCGQPHRLRTAPLGEDDRVRLEGLPPCRFIGFAEAQSGFIDGRLPRRRAYRARGARR